MEKLIITAPRASTSTIPYLSSDLPILPKQTADSVIDAAGAGVAEINLFPCHSEG